MIRSQFDTEEARAEAWQEEFTQAFGDQLADMDAQSQAQAQRAQRFSQALRFICPSYYAPGKQAWGAF